MVRPKQSKPKTPRQPNTISKKAPRTSTETTQETTQKTTQKTTPQPTSKTMIYRPHPADENLEAEYDSDYEMPAPSTSKQAAPKK